MGPNDDKVKKLVIKWYTETVDY